jgi:succinate-semialdehyde dehydrogenase/glutarate-semialdehyde dehydrogenase
MSAGAYPELRLLIAGEWRTTAATFPVHDPATGKEIGRVPHATKVDLEDALGAAERGHAVWRRVPPAERAAIIRTAARLLGERADRVSEVITCELGKPRPDADLEVRTAIGILEWNADEGTRGYGRLIPGSADARQLVVHEPIGPVAAFSPWNVPLISPARKISAALAAGCSVIIKPAEETPGAATLLAEAFLDAGLPADVLGLVLGDPATISETLLSSSVIRAVTFTGSTTVGRHLATTAAQHLKRSVMELGGHAPVVVCADADPLEVAEGAARAAFRSSGQVCTSPTRFFVARELYPEFVERLSALVAALRAGNGLDPASDIGPVLGPRRVEALEHLVADAVAKGARVTAGGHVLPGIGSFFAPTVIADVGPDCDVSQIEPFGPLATVAPYDDLDEAVRRANETPYGLAGYIFGHNTRVLRRLEDELDCGAIAVNHWQVSAPETPFGGHRDSGFGVEGGSEGIAAFQQVKYISER